MSNFTKPIKSNYSFEELMPYINGKKLWPHRLDRSVEDIAAIIAYGGGLQLPPASCMTRIKHPDGYVDWARYFFPTTQRGGLDGSAYVLYYKVEKGKGRPHGAFVALCDHAPVELPGARPMYGWHPAFCSKCGLNLTVDSGD